MNTKMIGQTHLGSPILCHSIGEGKKQVLILGGVHGDEVEGVAVANALLKSIYDKPIRDLVVHMVPLFNVDGILLKTRANARGVDLNRNLPTKDWDPEAFTARYFPGESANSEPENHALVRWLEENKVDFIFSFHSFHKYLLNVNGDCSPYAEMISEKTSYPIEASMGYPTPGCLGTFTGFEKKIPTITYELERDKNVAELIQVHVPAVYETLEAMASEEKKI